MSIILIVTIGISIFSPRSPHSCRIPTKRDLIIGEFFIFRTRIIIKFKDSGVLVRKTIRNK